MLFAAKWQRISRRSGGWTPTGTPSESQAVLDYTIWMVVHGMLRRHRQGGRPSEGEFKLVHQQEVLEFICKYGDRLVELTPRMAWKLAMARRHDPNYEGGMGGTTGTEYEWPGLILPEPPRLISPAIRRSTELATVPPEPEHLSPSSPKNLVPLQPIAPEPEPPLLQDFFRHW